MAIGQLPHPLDRLLPPLGDDRVGAQLAGEVGSVPVVAEDDDPLGAEPLGGDHAAESDGPVADHRHRLARFDAGDHRRVVTGAEHVGQGQEGGHQRLVRIARQRVQGPVCLGNPQRLGLGAAGLAAVAEEAAVQALGLQAVVAEDATAVGVGERHHHQVALLDGGDVAADVLDDADGLVPHDPRPLSGIEVLVGPEVAAADAGAGDPDHRVGRLLDPGVGNLFDAHVTRPVHDSRPHHRRLPAIGAS